MGRGEEIKPTLGATVGHAGSGIQGTTGDTINLHTGSFVPVSLKPSKVCTLKFVPYTLVGNQAWMHEYVSNLQIMQIILFLKCCCSNPIPGLKVVKYQQVTLSLSVH